MLPVIEDWSKGWIWILLYGQIMHTCTPSLKLERHWSDWDFTVCLLFGSLWSEKDDFTCLKCGFVVELFLPGKFILGLRV